MLVGEGVPHGGRTTFATVAGLAFYWQFYRWANIRNIVAGGGAGDGGLLPLAFYGAVLAIALALLSAKSLPARLVSSRLALVAGSVASVALAGAWAGSLALNEGFAAFATASFALAACSFSVLTLAWARRCRMEARANAKRAVLLVCLSSLASFALASVNSLAANDHALLAVAAPAASALCLLPGDGRAERKAVSRGEPPAALASRPVVAVLVSLLVLIVCMKGVSDAFYATESDAMLYLKHFITVVELAAIVFACLFATDMGRFAFAGWVVLVGGVLSGLSLLFFPGEPSAAFQFGLGTVTAGRTCLELFVFILATCLSARDELRSTLMLLVVPETAGCLIGYGALPFALRSAGVAGGEWFGALSLGACAVTVVSTLLAMSLLALKGLEGPPSAPLPAEAPEDDSRRFDEVARRFSLTKREGETAYLFYRGYSAKRIADLHYVSLNTTQSHLRSVYRKMGVHNRQQLIDLVEAELESGPGRA